MRAAELPILNPCQEDYGAMAGSAQRRFCDRCEKHVHDLSAMTKAQASALLEASGSERICVRYRSSPDGRIRFRPASRTAAFVAVVSLAMAACTGYAETDGLESPETAMMCRDASGYAVDCDLLDEGYIPDAPPSDEGPTLDADPVPQPEAEPEPEPEPDDAIWLGQRTDPEPSQDQPAELTDDEPVLKPCPLPQGDRVTVGEIEMSPRQRRRMKRRARRDERRRRKHRDDDIELMGAVVID